MDALAGGGNDTTTLSASGTALDMRRATPQGLPGARIGRLSLTGWRSRWGMARGQAMRLAWNIPALEAYLQNTSSTCDTTNVTGYIDPIFQDYEYVTSGTALTSGLSVFSSTFGGGGCWPVNGALGGGAGAAFQSSMTLFGVKSDVALLTGISIVWAPVLSGSEVSVSDSTLEGLGYDYEVCSNPISVNINNSSVGYVANNGCSDGWTLDRSNITSFGPSVSSFSAVDTDLTWRPGAGTATPQAMVSFLPDSTFNGGSFDAIPGT